MTKTLLILLLSTLFLHSGKVNTKNYWKCNNKVGGSWNFGRVPNGCDVQPFGDPSYVYDNFSPLVFNDNTKSTSQERSRYMNEMVAVIKDAAIYYLETRNPSASQAEKEAWSNAILAKAHQETFLTHYRTASDKRLKMIRGDYGHGHGLMQIDDRWHFAKINEGKGWNIFENILYALEIYYDGWTRAKKASCVKSLYDQSRAAYSIYNGGASKVCRWTNPNDRWARNDKNYKSKLDKKTWENYVDDMSANSSLNVGCYLEGNDVCSGVTAPNDSQTFANRLLMLSSGEYCLFKDDLYICTEQLRDTLCLAKEQNVAIKGDILEVSPAKSKVYDVITKGREVCYQNIPNLYKIGDYVKTAHAINVRDGAGGALQGQAPELKTYQILDFEVKEDSYKRYYKIKGSDFEGYIYAGNNQTHQTWATKSQKSQESQVMIASEEETVVIKAKSGINARESIGGDVVGVARAHQQYRVLKTKVQGKENYIYYQIDLEGTPAYIYGGKLLPTSNQGSWATYAGTYIPPVFKTTLKKDMWWDYLWSCASSDCSRIGYIIGKELGDYCADSSFCSYEEDSVEVLETSGAYSKIKLDKDGSEGYIKTEYLEPIQ